MKFRIRVKNDKNEWWEEYNKPEVTDQASADAKGREYVDYYNSTLRPHELPRTFLYAELDAGNAALAHDWQKTNLTTLFERGRVFDTLKCKRCGITAKRFGVGNTVIDGKFRARAFLSCDTARALIAKRQARKAELK